MARWATRQTISASSFCLVAPLPFTLSPTLLTPVSQRTQVRFLLVKLETKIILGDNDDGDHVPELGVEGVDPDFRDEHEHEE